MLEHSDIARGPERNDVRYEEIFLARYGRLRAWALRLTEGDAARAEDLVHDAFVQFTLTRPDLARVRNLEGYLYRMLRNLNVSQARRARRRREDATAVVEYDSAEFALRATDPRELIRVQDELGQVCRYACLRKETSKAGSVLILRFMHGYYPGEIALLMCSSREAVEERLRVARSEAAQFLRDPSSLRFMSREAGRAKKVSAAGGFAQSPDELLGALRRAVFESRRGQCPPTELLTDIYRSAETPGPDCATLAHLVSCPRCIDVANELHGLPPLSERHPVDSLGMDARRKRGGGNGDGGGGGNSGGDDNNGGDTPTGGASADEARTCARRARDVFEHRPRELCVAVNGRLLGAQKVGAAFNEQELFVAAGEEVEFVEIFSEQDVRLLYLDPAAWPAEGDGARTVRVALGDRRTLEARLSYVDSAPIVQVVYHDPLAPAEPAVAAERVAEDEGQQVGAIEVDVQRADARRRSGGGRLLGARAAAWRWLRELLSGLSRPRAVLRPGVLVAAFAVLLVAALLFTKFLYVPTVSAAELLRRAAAVEEADETADSGLVLRRTVFVEESKRDARGTSVFTRRRVETWRGGASRISLRRLYDEQGRLAASVWRKSDGTSAVYRRGAVPAEEGTPRTAVELLDAGEVWRIEPSARSFGALGAGGGQLKVDDRLGAYVVGYEAAAGGEGLTGAELWLNKSTLRAFRMTLFVRRDGQTIEYRLIESEFEKRRAEDVPPSVYQLEPELLGAAQGTKNENGSTKAQSVGGARPASAVPHAATVASAELEVEVAYLLNGIKANLGEQVSMGRTTGGALRVEALVESGERKEAILRALGPVLKNPAIEVEVSTVAEALERRARQPEAAPHDPAEREVNVRAGRIPADEELRAYFAARLTEGDRVDAEIKRFASRAMSHSRRALLHASALKRLAGRFTPAEARALRPDARAKWLSMIREHAESYGREVSALRAQLGAVFHAGDEGAPAEAVDEAGLGEAAERLLRLSYAQDGAVRSAFTISEEGGTAASIKSRGFRRTLVSSERLAAAIREAYER